MPNPNDPRLSIRVSLIEAIDSSHRRISHFKTTRFNIDRHYLAVITCFNLGTHLRFINLIATSGKFLLAVAGLSDCHGRDDYGNGCFLILTWLIVPIITVSTRTALLVTL
jgi:hypothetical protein